MENLINGYRAFRRQSWHAERERFRELARLGQRPETLVIACSDSRTDPVTVFNARPGELFVIRNVAAIVPPFESDASYHGTSAAIAFAVLSLNVRNILVLGHAQCGGVAAALDHSISESIPFLKSWIDLLTPAVERIEQSSNQGDSSQFVEREAVRLSLERLMTFPFVAERVSRGSLELNGARFSIADGALEVLDRESGLFHQVG